MILDLLAASPAVIPTIPQMPEGLSLWDKISFIVAHNQVAQAALLAAPATAITYAARNLPGKIGGKIKHFFSYDLTFRSDQDEYYYVNHLVQKEVVSERWSRDFAYDHVTLWNSENASEEDMFVGMSIGYGTHFGKYGGQFVIARRDMEEDSQTLQFKETLTLTFIGRSNAAAQKFCQHVATLMEERTRDDRINLRRNHYTSWSNHGKLSRRPLASVFTKDNIGQRVLDHIVEFEKSRDECLSKGLPWHTGVMLKGPPGTGKTSLIHALASELGRDVCFLNLSALPHDRDLAELIGCRRDWHKTLLVIEDIDAANANVTRDSEDEGVSLSTMLNVLDGFLTPEGMVTIATTNHPENLDEALMRKGRFDMNVELGSLGWEEAKQMAELLMGENNQFGKYEDSYVPKTGAELREAMLADSLDDLFSV